MDKWKSLLSQSYKWNNHNFEKKYPCKDFYNFLLIQPKLLNVISLCKKYNTKNYDAENYEQSTSILNVDKNIKNNSFKVTTENKHKCFITLLKPILFVMIP